MQFSDNFTPGASSDWSNLTGNWTTSDGTYFAQAPNNNPFASTFLPFDMSNTNLRLTVTVNDFADGGIWFDADGDNTNGVLLVLGGKGYGNGTRGGDAGNSIYWHIATNGSISGQMDPASNVFTTGGTYIITVTGGGAERLIEIDVAAVITETPGQRVA